MSQIIQQGNSAAMVTTDSTYKTKIYIFIGRSNNFQNSFIKPSIRYFSFENIKTDELLTNNIKLLDGKINQFKSALERNKTYNHQILFETIQIYEFTADGFVKRDSEKYIMQIINDDNYIASLSASDMAKLFYFLVF